MSSLNFRFRNFVLYLFGMVAISFGVVMMLRSNLGLSTWDTLHDSLHNAFGITMGTATIVIATMFTIAVVLLNKHWKYVLMGIPIFIVGILIDVINLHLLVDFSTNTMFQQIASYAIGLIILPLGGSLLIISTFPAGVFDEFNLAVMKVLKTNKLILIRVIMELTAVTVALLINLLSGNGIGAMNIGTLIFAVSVGYILKQFLLLFERIGLYENKQND